MKTWLKRLTGGPPHWPAAANLAPGGKSAMPLDKDAVAFAAMLRSGERPDGSKTEVMPFESLAKMSDLSAQALYASLRTVPARPFGQR